MPFACTLRRSARSLEFSLPASSKCHRRATVLAIRLGFCLLLNALLTARRALSSPVQFVVGTRPGTGYRDYANYTLIPQTTTRFALPSPQNILVSQHRRSEIDFVPDAHAAGERGRRDEKPRPVARHAVTLSRIHYARRETETFGPYNSI